MTLKMARLSAITATIVLTAAVFLLPGQAVDARKPVQVMVATQIEVAH